MTKSPTKSKRRMRRHGDLPAGFVWREGRPRWIPSPTRRAQGWRGHDLKDQWGKWLPMGAAIERAQVIAAAVEAWSAGVAVPAGLANVAPKGATASGATPAALAPRSIGALMDAYFESAKFVATEARGKRLGERTQADYKNKLRRFLEVLAESTDPKKVARIRALDVDILLPPPFGSDADFELQKAADVLAETAGESMAYGVMACVSAWLNWCVKKRRIWPTNPAALVERSAPDGRIVVYEWPELLALVRAAEAAGLASIGDAIVLAVDLSWSQQDVLALTWGQVNDGRVKHRRIKTGVAGNPPLLLIGRSRLDAIRQRWAGQKVRPTHVIVCELTGRPWSADTFRHYFSQIRATVAEQLPDVAGKQFRDTRDTTVTYCIEAGLTLEETCSRTLHKPTRAQAVIEKHYGAIRQTVADQAAIKLDAHYQAQGYSFETLLALPTQAKEVEQ
jgi:hypothetical protein